MAEALYQPHSAEGPEGAPYPGWVSAPEHRERWDVCYKIVARLSGLMEADGVPDQRFVWVGTRALYNSDTPTGELGDGAVEEAEHGPDLDQDAEAEVLAALELPDGVADTPSEEERAALVREIGDARPADDAPEAEWWAWLGRMADALDGLLGGHLEGLDELGEPLLSEAFSEAQHPRNRIGKWTGKIGGLRRIASEHGEHFRHRLGLTLAAARLKRETSRAHKPGGALHGKLKHAGTREEHLRVAAARIATATGKDEEEVRKTLRTREVMRGHAQEERHRRGLSGRRQQAIRGGNIAGGATLSSIHRALVADPSATLAKEVEGHHDKGARRVAKGAAGAAGTYEFDPRQPKDIHGVGSTAEDAKTVADKAFDLTRWAHEHADELKAAGHAAKHLLHAAARAKGLAASASDEELEAEAFHADLVHTV